MERKKVYLSYDLDIGKDSVLKLKKSIMESEYDVLLKNPQNSISESIRLEISKASLCIFVLKSTMNPFILKEIEYAAQLGKQIITFVKDIEKLEKLTIKYSTNLLRRQAIYNWETYDDLNSKVVNALDTFKMSSFQRGMLFEKLISNILTYVGWNVKDNFQVRNSNTVVNGWDLIIDKENITYYVEIKFYRSKYIETGRIKDILRDIEKRRELDINIQNRIILILGNVIDENQRKIINTNGVLILDIKNILYLVNNNEYLRNQLLSIIEYSLDDITYEEPFLDFTPLNTEKKENKEKNAIEEYIDKLKFWQPKKNLSSTYEKLCTNVLKELFIDDLSVWQEQKKSNDDLYRFDLICKIKDEKINPFWKFIEDFFNSKYIIFEYKNYSNFITQKEIYTTEKYLYAKALRGVAIILSCNGSDNNAEKAIKGILRENGKLIISLSNKDIICMLENKLKKEEAADYLYDKLDIMLMELEK